MANEITFKMDELSSNLDDLKDRISAGVYMICQSEAVRLEASMKSHRPWTDRTGAAKARLMGQAIKESDTLFTIALSHGVTYGIWLELANNKNYAIIMPTIQQEQGNVLQSVANMLNNL